MNIVRILMKNLKVSHGVIIMSPESWQIYVSALEAWKNKQYTEAEEILSNIPERDKNYHKVILLLAYIQCYTSRPLSMIITLTEKLSMLEEGNRAILPDVYNLLAAIHNKLGNARQSVEFFLLSSAEERSNNNSYLAVAEYSNAIFASASIADFSLEDAYRLYGGYEQLLSDIFTPLPQVNYNHQKLRVGYVSGDFHRHPVGYLLYPLTSKFSRDSFNVYCYSVETVNDDVATAFRNCPVTWRDVSSLDYNDLANQIRSDEIDILIDCGGHTMNNRVAVFTLRPAPIQISTIGWVGSTGMRATDYILTDRYCAPIETNPFYTEKFLQLPHSHFVFHLFDKKFPNVEILPYLRNGYITFGCFNNFAKVTDEMLCLWRDIMAAVPNSRLILKNKLLGNEEGRLYAKNRLENTGIDCNYVEFRGVSADYLEQYNDMDIALDTFPYVGGMTTFEALYMGVPVISRYGQRHGERFGYSLLCNVGLEMLTAGNPEEYVAKAVALANDTNVLQELRTNLRDMVQASPLMDEDLYVADVENIFKLLVTDKLS